MSQSWIVRRSSAHEAIISNQSDGILKNFHFFKRFFFGVLGVRAKYVRLAHSSCFLENGIAHILYLFSMVETTTTTKMLPVATQHQHTEQILCKYYGKWNNENYMIFYFASLFSLSLSLSLRLFVAYFYFAFLFIIHMCACVVASCATYFSLSIYG